MDSKRRKIDLTFITVNMNIDFMNAKYTKNLQKCKYLMRF